MPTHISTRNKKFESLFYTWNKKIYNYAYQKTNSSYIAEETVQRVFIKLWNNLENKKIDINQINVYLTLTYQHLYLG